MSNRSHQSLWRRSRKAPRAFPRASTSSPLVRFDSDRSVLIEDSASTGPRVGREDHVLAANRDARLDVAYGVALKPGGEREAT